MPLPTYPAIMDDLRCDMCVVEPVPCFDCWMNIVTPQDAKKELPDPVLRTIPLPVIPPNIGDSPSATDATAGNKKKNSRRNGGGKKKG